MKKLLNKIKEIYYNIDFNLVFFSIVVSFLLSIVVMALGAIMVAHFWAMLAFVAFGTYMVYRGL